LRQSSSCVGKLVSQNSGSAAASNQVCSGRNQRVCVSNVSRTNATNVRLSTQRAGPGSLENKFLIAPPRSAFGRQLAIAPQPKVHSPESVSRIINFRTLVSRRQNVQVSFVHHLQRLAATAGYASERIIRYQHRQAGLACDQLVHAQQQRAATS